MRGVIRLKPNLLLCQFSNAYMLTVPTDHAGVDIPPLWDHGFTTSALLTVSNST
jgi:hypothetical protein